MHSILSKLYYRDQQPVAHELDPACQLKSSSPCTTLLKDKLPTMCLKKNGRTSRPETLPFLSSMHQTGQPRQALSTCGWIATHMFCGQVITSPLNVWPLFIKKIADPCYMKCSSVVWSSLLVGIAGWYCGVRKGEVHLYWKLPWKVITEEGEEFLPRSS